MPNNANYTHSTLTATPSSSATTKLTCSLGQSLTAGRNDAQEISVTDPNDGLLYKAIKARIIAYEFGQGERIYLEPIAKQLRVSTWPVRQIFDRLAVEGLVKKAPHKGFFALTLSKDNVIAHYQITRHFLSLGLETLEPAARRKLPDHEPIAAVSNKLKRRELSDGNTLASYTGELFAVIAALTEKAAIIDAIERSNDQLFYIRTLECQYLEDVQCELMCFCELLLADNCVELKSAVRNYHERRLAVLPTLFDFMRQ